MKGESCSCCGEWGRLPAFLGKERCWVLKPMNPASHRRANSSSTLQASVSGPVHALLMASGHPMRVNSFSLLPCQESRAVSHRALGSTRRGQTAHSKHRCLPSLHVGKGASARVTHWMCTFSRRLQLSFPVPVHDAGKVSPRGRKVCL